MCGRYLLTPPVEALRQLFMFEQRPNLMPRYDVALTQGVPIVRLTRDAAGRELIMVRWGLVPFWADDLTIGNRLINARCETVHSARAFRETYSRQRCLVPTDGSFEWHCDGNVVRSCTIITCPANELVAPLHHRIPVILAPEAHARWLDPKTDTRGLLQSLDMAGGFPGRPASQQPAERRPGVHSTGRSPNHLGPIAVKKAVPARRDRRVLRGQSSGNRSCSGCSEQEGRQQAQSQDQKREPCHETRFVRALKLPRQHRQRFVHHSRCRCDFATPAELTSETYPYG